MISHENVANHESRVEGINIPNQILVSVNGKVFPSLLWFLVVKLVTQIADKSLDNHQCSITILKLDLIFKHDGHVHDRTANTLKGQNTDCYWSPL